MCVPVPCRRLRRPRAVGMLALGFRFFWPAVCVAMSAAAAVAAATTAAVAVPDRVCVSTQRLAKRSGSREHEYVERSRWAEIELWF